MKNLIFVFADQWRRTAVGFAGEEPVFTPNIDAFARRGVVCTNAVSSYPLCSPHRASLLTGKRPLSTGVFTNCKAGLSMRLSDNEQTLGDVLKAAGYRTGYIGKWHLDEPELNHTQNSISGACDWDAYTPPGKARHGFDTWYSYGACDDHLSPHYWQNSPSSVQVDDWSVRHETDKALKFIAEQNAKTPFALVLSYNPPHNPYEQVPNEYLKHYENDDLKLRANVKTDNLCYHTGEQINYTPEQLQCATKQYYAAVTGIDDQFARILAALDSNGLTENTCVVLSADHGDMMGSHGLMAKHVWYEESIGIPFIACGPGITPGTCASVLASEDIMPTLLDWLCLLTPDSVEGKSRFSQMQAHTQDDDSLATICACPGSKKFLKEFAAANLDPRCFGWRALRTLKYTYVIELGYTPHPCTRRYLYSLSDDAYQMNPIILQNASENATALELEDMLIKRLREQKDGFVNYIDITL
ncbi:MAG: sulfatase [Oscillospiraceae bacterium]